MSYIIHPIVTARIAVDTGRLTYLRNYGKRAWLPCPFYVITGGPEPVLVDTSASADLMSHLRLEPVEHVLDFQEGLASAGFSLKEIRIVILTHLMYDHCANSKLLPNARFTVQKRELDFALAPTRCLREAISEICLKGCLARLLTAIRSSCPASNSFSPRDTAPDASPLPYLRARVWPSSQDFVAFRRISCPN